MPTRFSCGVVCAVDDDGVKTAESTTAHTSVRTRRPGLLGIACTALLRTPSRMTDSFSECNETEHNGTTSQADGEPNACLSSASPPSEASLRRSAGGRGRRGSGDRDRSREELARRGGGRCTGKVPGAADLQRLEGASSAAQVGREAWSGPGDRHRVRGRYGAGVSRLLLGCGQDVQEVPSTLTHRERRRRASQGKSDLVDSVAIARIAASGEELPSARTLELLTDIRALVDYRDQLVRARTQ